MYWRNFTCQNITQKPWLKSVLCCTNIAEQSSSSTLTNTTCIMGSAQSQFWTTQSTRKSWYRQTLCPKIKFKTFTSSATTSLKARASTWWGPVLWSVILSLSSFQWSSRKISSYSFIPVGSFSATSVSTTKSFKSLSCWTSNNSHLSTTWENFQNVKKKKTFHLTRNSSIKNSSKPSPNFSSSKIWKMQKKTGRKFS